VLSVLFRFTDSDFSFGIFKLFLCHIIHLDIVDNKHVFSLVNDFESGKWRQGEFQEYIWNNIAETALSKEEEKNLVGKSASILKESAKNLRISEDSGKGSELCEILLYGIMKDHYSALPVVPKIFYKQNSQDNAKGADSVHIVIKDNDFSLWFGEAKFYLDIDRAITSAVDSVDAFLRNDDQIKKENSIITSVSDIDQMGLSDELVKQIKSTLNGKNSLDNIKPKINIPILLLYECNISNISQSSLPFPESSEIRKFFADSFKMETDFPTRFFSSSLDSAVSAILFQIYSWNSPCLHLPLSKSLTKLKTCLLSTISRLFISILTNTSFIKTLNTDINKSNHN
jgi:hypothetical protein